MNQPHTNRFDDFFEDDHYVSLKNHLYNYFLRKRAIKKALKTEDPQLILEVGSGISPTVTETDRIIYAELSTRALRMLKEICPRGRRVAANNMQLPFKSEVFTHTICSEVLEHLTDDRAALKELARVTKPLGYLIITFPHRRFYFANDDDMVGHLRRYELSEMEERLEEAGFQPVQIEKILGPLEKVTMCLTAFCFSFLRVLRSKKRERKSSKALRALIPFFKWANRCYAVLAWLDARITPRALSAVILIKAIKQERGRR